VAVADVWHIAGQTHDRLRLLADIPENLRDRIPQSYDLLRLGWLEELLERDGLLLRAVVEDEIFDDKSLDDGLKASRRVLRRAKAEGILGRVVTVENSSSRPFARESRGQNR
jgi:hypothetical protein